MKIKKKKVTKKRKKFFIILTCYIAVFLITCVTTAATLAWFNGSTWSRDTLYMGGPVYIYFSDTSGVKETSKAGALHMETPPGWNNLYPGMNFQIQARAVVEGAEFDHLEETGETTIVYATGAILRAKIMLRVKQPDGTYDSDITRSIYNNIWHQVKSKAITNNDPRNDGVWVMDSDYNYSTENLDEDHYFYYVKKNQTFTDSGKYELLDVGGGSENVSVGFLDNAVVTLSGIQFTNEHADCQVEFTITFHALQGFLPYLQSDIGNAYQGDTTGRSPYVTWNDVGMPKPLTIENSRSYFYEAFSEIYGTDAIV